MSKRAAVAASMLLALSLVSCSAVEDAAGDAASASVCTVVTGLADQARSLLDEAATGATAQELRARAEALRVTAEGIGATLGALAGPAADALQEASEAFDRAVAQVPADATAEVARDAYTAAAERFRFAIDEAAASLGC